MLDYWGHFIFFVKTQKGFFYKNRILTESLTPPPNAVGKRMIITGTVRAKKIFTKVALYPRYMLELATRANGSDDYESDWIHAKVIKSMNQSEEIIVAVFELH